MRTTRILPFIGCAAALAVGTASADAATTRYIGPASLPVGDCTSAAQACTPAWALGPASSPGDTVVVLPGAYNIPGPIVLTERLDIRAADGAKPTLSYGGSGTAISLQTGASGTTLTGFNLRTTGTDALGLEATVATSLMGMTFTSEDKCVDTNARLTVADSSFVTDATSDGCINAIGLETTFQRVAIRAENLNTDGVALAFAGPDSVLEDATVITPGGTAVLAYNPSVRIRRSHLRGGRAGLLGAHNARVEVTDSLITAAGNTADGVLVLGGGETRLRNVTAHAGGPSGTAINAAFAEQNGLGGKVEARNVIAFGGDRDLVAGQQGTIDVSHSNFRTMAGEVNDLGSNQSGDPLFRDVAAGDFHLLEGSPAIDAGGPATFGGALDLDGAPRQQGAAPDIGAYESSYPPAPQPESDPGPQPGGEPGTGSGSTPHPGQPAQRDASAPVIGRVVATKRKRGARFRYTLSEAALVTVTVDRTAAGRRKGKRCAKPARANRRAKRCTRYVKARTLTRAGAAGSNQVAFSGRPGSYRATFTARDADGNTSKSRSVRFRIR